MILVDANLLIYAGIENQANHRAASAWLQAQIQLGHRIGMPWPCLLASCELRLTQESMRPRPPSRKHIQSWSLGKIAHGLDTVADRAP